MNEPLKCQGWPEDHDTPDPAITHLDEKGFIYCTKCGINRRESGVYCRRLRAWELRLLEAGEPVPSYKPLPIAQAFRGVVDTAYAARAKALLGKDVTS